MDDAKSRISEKLKRFLPEEGLEQVVSLIAANRVKFRITHPRKTKFGDYKSQDKDGYHHISVNGNLNPFAFYLTTIHEFAHLIAFAEYGRTILPHGKEWKMVFSQLLITGKSPEWFPIELKKPLIKYIKNPKASSASDHDLFMGLRMFDKKNSILVAKDLEKGERFILSGRIFERGDILRKRIQCMEVRSGKLYLVNAIAEVQKVTL